MGKTEFTVRLLRIAEDDLSEIIAYIAADRPKSADAMLDRIERTLSNIAAHPHIGRIPDDDELAALSYRFLVVDNYLIFYTIEPKTVLVHRIIHGARDYLKLL